LSGLVVGSIVGAYVSPSKEGPVVTLGEIEIGDWVLAALPLFFIFAVVSAVDGVPVGLFVTGEVDPGEAEGVDVTGVNVDPIMVGARDMGEAVGFIVGVVAYAVGTTVCLVGTSVCIVGAVVLVVGDAAPSTPSASPTERTVPPMPRIAVATVGTTIFVEGVTVEMLLFMTVGLSVFMTAGVSVFRVGADVFTVGTSVCGVKAQAPSTVAV
jgi:hypothetical protein